MSTLPTPTISPALTNAIQTLPEQVAIPLLLNTVQNIKATPTAANAAAQGAALGVSVLAAAPTLESDAILAIASALETQLLAAQAKLTAASSATGA